jgi:hypothetical protein
VGTVTGLIDALSMWTADEEDRMGREESERPDQVGEAEKQPNESQLPDLATSLADVCEGRPECKAW